MASVPECPTPLQWRPMAAADRDAVERVGTAVHPDHPEGAAVLEERLRLYPAGCLVLGEGSCVAGYVVAHPWRFGDPPRLDTLLGGLPERADTFYLHDLAILPGLRGRGLGEAAVERLVRHAVVAGFANVSLVAVGRSPAFWRRQGFSAVDRADVRGALSSYGSAVFMARRLS